jgi:hypothetical protein
MKSMPVICLLLVVLGGTATAADVHGVTWVRKAVAPGTVVSIGGKDFVLVRLPMKEFSNGNRYVVEYLADVIDPGPPVSFFSDISTVHSNDTILNPVTVSGYPASLNVQDGRSYSYTDGTGLDDGLTVDSLAYGNVTMKVGDVMLSFGTFFTVPQQTLTAVPTGTYASSSYAKWNQYVDPTSLVTQFDNWIDYIRVLKIN